MAIKANKIKIMAGSTTYGFGDWLSLIIANVTSLVFNVLNSYKV